MTERNNERGQNEEFEKEDAEESRLRCNSYPAEPLWAGILETHGKDVELVPMAQFLQHSQRATPNGIRRQYLIIDDASPKGPSIENCVLVESMTRSRVRVHCN
jgi:hypothetical protein